MKNLLFRWSELKATFWFIPVIIIIASIVLSISLVYLDGQIDFSQDGLGRYFFVNSSNSARSILSTISGAMMGVAGTVFSITLVALTLASSQFGPRLIKNFMYVRLNQIVLGAYISTYLYCLLILNAVKEGNDYTFIPSISILVAILAAITNIILLIIFIHNIAISIQADYVISDITGYIARQVKELFPNKTAEQKEKETTVDVAAAISGYRTHISLKSPKSGYLQYVNRERVIGILSKRKALFVLHYRAGGHLVEGIEIGVLYSSDTWEIQDVKNLLDQFVIGKTKTPKQDLEFSIQQMVEIASRALSPGINDPYTAITCIDNLTATLSYLAHAEFPSKNCFDKEGTLRMIANTVEFEGVLDVSFNQIRQFSGGSPAVMIRMMEALTTLNNVVTDGNHRKFLQRHAEMVLNLGKQSIKDEHDLQDLIVRSRKILN